MNGTIVTFDSLVKAVKELRHRAGATVGAFRAHPELVVAMHATDPAVARKSLFAIITGLSRSPRLREPMAVLANALGFGPSASATLLERRNDLAETIGRGVRSLAATEEEAIDEVAGFLMDLFGLGLDADFMRSIGFDGPLQGNKPLDSVTLPLTSSDADALRAFLAERQGGGEMAADETSAATTSGSAALEPDATLPEASEQTADGEQATAFTLIRGRTLFLLATVTDGTITYLESFDSSVEQGVRATASADAPGIPALIQSTPPAEEFDRLAMVVEFEGVRPKHVFGCSATTFEELVTSSRRVEQPLTNNTTYIVVDEPTPGRYWALWWG